MTYEKYNGREAFVSLAEEKYTHIAPKAFLSCKSIQSLQLPKQLEGIGDWAFAHMQNLTDLYLPAKPISLGKKVFLDCESLQHIHLYADNSENPGLSQLLGAAITILQNMQLFQPHLAGNQATHAAWLGDFDTALESFITSPDEQDFEPVFYGWFNDEDADSTQLPKYLHKQRAKKLHLAFLRLRYPKHLQEPLKKLLQEYLADHMPEGKDAHRHTITWELLPRYCSNDIMHIQLLSQASALSRANIPEVIAHLPDASPEIIAYLLRLQADLQENISFFDNFSL